MRIFGLTGSIGMGKSTAASMLRRMGLQVYCADEAVHHALAPGGAAVPQVGKLYPKALSRNKEGREFIDRNILGQAAFQDTTLMGELEKILHPLATKAREGFLKRARAHKKKLVVFDIPLLFEKRLQKYVDKTIVVSAPSLIQKLRVMARPGMDKNKFYSILARQMPDREKRKRADIIIPTGLGRAHTWRKLKQALRI